MKPIKKILAIFLVLTMIFSLAACKGNNSQDNNSNSDDKNTKSENGDSSSENDSKYDWDKKYSIPNVTLCEHDPFDFSLTNAAQFRMRADVYDSNASQEEQPEIYKMLDQAMMIYSTATIDEVKSFLEENITCSADIDSLDAANRCRLLTKGASGSKLEYLEIGNEESTGFYKVGLDLITMSSICQTSGVYHFYIASIADGQIKWVEEAKDTFEMTQDIIDVRNALIDFVYTTSYETDNPDAKNYDVTKKEEIVKNSIVEEIGNNIPGLDISVKNVENSTFDVTVSKGNCSHTESVELSFGPVADPNAWLVNIKADHILPAKDANSFGLVCSFGPAYDDTQAKKMFVCYSSEDLETVRQNLMPLTYEEIEALYPEEGEIYLRIRDVMNSDTNGTEIYALSTDSNDVINRDVDMFETEGTYYMYIGVLSDTGVLWIGQLEEQLQK